MLQVEWTLSQKWLTGWEVPELVVYSQMCTWRRSASPNSGWIATEPAQKSSSIGLEYSRRKTSLTWLQIGSTQPNNSTATQAKSKSKYV